MLFFQTCGAGILQARYPRGRGRSGARSSPSAAGWELGWALGFSWGLGAARLDAREDAGAPGNPSLPLQPNKHPSARAEFQFHSAALAISPFKRCRIKDLEPPRAAYSHRALGLIIEIDD